MSDNSSSASDHQLVWGEIPVTDLEAARLFYGAVFKRELSITSDGPNDMIMLSISDSNDAVAGHIYPGKPAPAGVGPTLHLMAPDDLEATADRVVEAGGKVLSPAIEIPTGSFIYTQDPDGNSIGWFRFKES